MNEKSSKTEDKISIIEQWFIVLFAVFLMLQPFTFLNQKMNFFLL
jgi:hypothetical protein